MSDQTKQQLNEVSARAAAYMIGLLRVRNLCQDEIDDPVGQCPECNSDGTTALAETILSIVNPIIDFSGKEGKP